MKYAGFWIRFWASVIDTIFLLMVFLPLMVSIYGLNTMSSSYSTQGMNSWSSSYTFSGSGNFFLNYLLPALVILAFWFFKSATPGKMLLKLKILDAKTGKQPTTMQFILRYLGYFLSSIFLLGFIWIAFDKKKQGFHDKIAGTIVGKIASDEEVIFESDER
jgi:uncharacterized RDD family membrane protein YckC